MCKVSKPVGTHVLGKCISKTQTSTGSDKCCLATLHFSNAKFRQLRRSCFYFPSWSPSCTSQLDEQAASLRPLLCDYTLCQPQCPSITFHHGRNGICPSKGIQLILNSSITFAGYIAYELCHDKVLSPLENNHPFSTGGYWIFIVCVGEEGNW